MSGISGSGEDKYRVMFNDFVHQSGDKGASMLGVIRSWVNHLSVVLKPIDFALQQDLVNDTAMAMLSNASYINEIGPSRVLYTMVRNRYIDVLRKESRRRELVVYSDIPESGQTGEPSSLVWEEDRYLNLECLEKIFDKVERQPGSDESVRILTSYAMGHSYEEISNHSKSTVSAITQRIHGLRKQLRQLHKTLCG